MKHLPHLIVILDRIQKARLTVKTKKCHFGANNINYFGPIVGGGEVQMEVSNIECPIAYYFSRKLYITQGR